MAANLKDSHKFGVPYACAFLSQECTNFNNRIPFSFQHCLYTTRDIFTTAQDCRANVGEICIAVINKKEINLSFLKQPSDYLTILVVNLEYSTIAYEKIQHKRNDSSASS